MGWKPDNMKIVFDIYKIRWNFKILIKLSSSLSILLGMYILIVLIQIHIQKTPSQCFFYIYLNFWNDIQNSWNTNTILDTSWDIQEYSAIFNLQNHLFFHLTGSLENWEKSSSPRCSKILLACHVTLWLNLETTKPKAESL